MKKDKLIVAIGRFDPDSYRDINDPRLSAWMLLFDSPLTTHTTYYLLTTTY